MGSVVSGISEGRIFLVLPENVLSEYGGRSADGGSVTSAVVESLKVGASGSPLDGATLVVVVRATSQR